MLAKICKGTAIAVAILGTIGAFQNAKSIGTASAILNAETSEFSVVAFLIGIIAVFLVALLFYSIGVLLEKLENLENLEKQGNAQSKAPSNLAPTHNPRIAAPINRPADSTWKCKKCGKTNNASQQSCMDCGEYK